MGQSVLALTSVGTSFQTAPRNKNMCLTPNMETAILAQVTDKLDALFISMEMPESHGLKHSQTVLANMEKTISSAAEEYSSYLTPAKLLTLRLAALLHEADDHKYFKTSVHFDNARKICEESIPDSVEEKQKIISEVVQMISFVSASANGNSVPEVAKSDPTFLWPRYCDRLESIGVIGAVRCYLYTNESGEPLMLDSTPRPVTEEELWAAVKEERWSGYQSTGGKSVSMMDHYYDKLLHVGKFDPAVVRSSYLEGEAKRRVKPLVELCLEAGRSGEAPIESLKKMEKSLC